MGEVVAAEQEQGKTIGVGGGGDHVGAAWPDRGSRHHDLATVTGLGEGHGCQSHSLFVLTPPGRQLVRDRLKGFPQAGYVAVPEDGEHSGEQPLAFTINYGFLGNKLFDHGLSCSQPDGFHPQSSPCCALAVVWQGF